VVGVGGGEDGAEREGERRVGGGVPVEEEEEGGGRGDRERQEPGEAARREWARGERGPEAGEVEWGEELRPLRRRRGRSMAGTWGLSQSHGYVSFPTASYMRFSS
jgi:hypothetical protein